MSHPEWSPTHGHKALQWLTTMQDIHALSTPELLACIQEEVMSDLPVIGRPYNLLAEVCDRLEGQP